MNGSGMHIMSHSTAKIRDKNGSTKVPDTDPLGQVLSGIVREGVHQF